MLELVEMQLEEDSAANQEDMEHQHNLNTPPQSISDVPRVNPTGLVDSPVHVIEHGAL